MAQRINNLNKIRLHALKDKTRSHPGLGRRLVHIPIQIDRRPRRDHDHHILSRRTLQPHAFVRKSNVLPLYPAGRNAVFDKQPLSVRAFMENEHRRGRIKPAVLQLIKINVSRFFIKRLVRR